MSGTTLAITPQEQQLSERPEAYSALAYAAGSTFSGMAPTSVQRRVPRPQDVEIAMLYWACYADLRQVREEWHASRAMS